MALFAHEIPHVPDEPAYRLAARRIETKIMSGEWAVGDRIPAETSLAQELGVHRSTVREAIRVLEQNGLVRRFDGGKLLYVTAPRASDISSKITAAIVLQEITFFELWETMRCIEPALVEGAAARISEATLDALQENLEKTKAALHDKTCLVRLDIEFHELIASASGNRALQLCRQPISQFFYPAFLNVFSRLNAGERVVYAHGQILDALRQRNAELAREWMDKHVVDFRRGYELASLDIDAPVGWPDKFDTV